MFYMQRRRSTIDREYRDTFSGAGLSQNLEAPYKRLLEPPHWGAVVAVAHRNIPRFAIAAIGISALSSSVGAEPHQEQRLDTIPNTSKVCPPVRPGSHQTYRLPQNRKLPEGITFATDWSGIATGGWFGEQVMDRCRMRPDGFVTWHGKIAVRIEVQPSDDPLNLQANSERAEMTTMQSSNGTAIQESARSGVQYYATSYYFPTNWQGQQLRWSSFAPIDCSTEKNRCNSWSFVWQFYGWSALSAAQTAVNGPQHYLFNGLRFRDGGLLTLGKWTDFIIMVDWRTGLYKVARRDEGQKFFIEVLQGKTIPPNRDVYVKQGLYRGGSVNGRTDVLWVGPTARGSIFSAVEREAFGTDNGISGPLDLR